MEEFEVGFLDIDVTAITEKLTSLGAKKVFEKKYRRKILAIPGSDDGDFWLRVRDEGEKVMLTYKKPIGLGCGPNGMDQGMEEIEVSVSDFDKTVTLLEKSGFQVSIYEENSRVRYDLNGVEVDLDTWPLIPTILEIEGKSWNDVNKTIEILGLGPEKKMICSVGKIYSLYGINTHDYSILTFEEQIKK